MESSDNGGCTLTPFVLFRRNPSITWRGDREPVEKTGNNAYGPSRLEFLTELLGRNETLSRIIDFMLYSCLPCRDEDVMILPSAFLVPHVFPCSGVINDSKKARLLQNSSKFYEWNTEAIGQYIYAGVHTSKTIGPDTVMETIQNKSSQPVNEIITRVLSRTYDLLCMGRRLKDVSLRFCDEKYLSHPKAPIGLDDTKKIIQKAFEMTVESIFDTSKSHCSSPVHSPSQDQNAGPYANDEILARRVSESVGDKDTIGTYKRITPSSWTAPRDTDIGTSCVFRLFVELTGALIVIGDGTGFLSRASIVSLRILTWYMAAVVAKKGCTKTREHAQTELLKLEHTTRLLGDVMNPLVVRWVRIASMWLSKEIRFHMTCPPHNVFSRVQWLFQGTEYTSHVSHWTDELETIQTQYMKSEKRVPENKSKKSDLMELTEDEKESVVDTEAEDKEEDSDATVSDAYFLEKN